MAAVNMTEGGITKHLVGYSIPLILGNMFQLTYNAVDSIIAGRFIGKEALAAEGTASPVMNIVILGISGICMGGVRTDERVLWSRPERKAETGNVHHSHIWLLFFSVNSHTWRIFLKTSSRSAGSAG